MKAAQHTTYNKKNITLNITEIATPSITDNEVLLKVTAAGVNPLDNMISRGEVKMIVPYKLPQTAGNEVVGIIEETGRQVKNLKVGDRVFGRLPLDHIGAFAEYVAVDSQALAKVPDYLSDEEAAAVPLTALTVMQALDLMGTQAGKTIFISGGTGGVGGMAIPIAKAKGLTVITNGAGDSAERVLNLGAGRFIDYKTEDYTKTVSQVDYVLDTLGGAETEKQMSIMKKGGQLVSLRAMPNCDFAKRMNLAKWKQILLGLAGRKFDKMADKYGVHYHFIFVESNGAQLQEVADLFSKLEIKPSIDTVYPFEEVNSALDKVANGRSRGKTILSFKK
ncbi:NADP-dependent oxidoreductase [Streptococcus sp. ACS2]|uniref:NADP-dependent oxidoreductase n=1 Tax=Streptococcus sp. ACS2 TaxID=936576 RepID=UPI000448472F|nr:NADP-dependent oxidoreductase [Streptococcus sp. ACS2]EUC60217.1 oxidoreductase, zinc-binding dehydrogenase family protein [Streptococcus sp. ACS2]